MNLTNAEKLTLVMLAELHEKLGIDTANADFIKEAIHSDNTWALSWQLTGIVGDNPDPTPPEVIEVLNIMGMWATIEEAYKALGARGQDAVLAAYKIKAAPVFRGFDGNNESEYLNIASFFVNHMDRFPEFKGRDFNSHVPSMEGYRRMLKVWKGRAWSMGMSVEQMTELLNAPYPA